MALKLIAEHIEDVEYITEENEKGEKEKRFQDSLVENCKNFPEKTYSRHSPPER